MIHIISYNIMSGENPTTILDSLKSFPEDAFITLQETNAPFIEAMIREAFPNAEIAFHNDSRPSTHRTGVTTIAPTKPIKSIKIDLPRLQGAFWKWLFWCDSSEVPQHRATLNKYLLSSGEELTIVNVHLEVLGWKKHKLQQVRVIKKALEEHGSDRAIILGDFNSSDVAWIVGVLEEGLELIGDLGAITVSMEHAISSVLSKRKWVHRLLKKRSLNKGFDSRKDWILVRGLTLKDEGVLEKHKGSDHYPIWAIFK
ncbi:hypothetical protein ACFL13_02935 [Patescibacteria group bacterium]